MSEEESYLRKELYELVRKDPAIFEFLQAGSLDGIWYWDIENPEQEWLSPRFKEVFGYRDHEILNTSAWWQANIFPDDLEVALDNFNKHCADPDHPYDQIVRYRHKNGGTVWVRCRGLAIRDDSGKPLRLLGCHTDVTALKQAEEDLRVKATELQRAKEIAESADQAKSEFLANTSHEVRTPLNTIIGMTELLLEEQLSPHQQEHLEAVLESAESLLAIITDILDFSKIDAGKLALERREFGLSDHLGNTLRALSVRAYEKGLELVYDLTPEVPDSVLGDPIRLRQIVTNLVANAIKFTERGEVELRVSCESEGDDHVVLRFAVSDTGIGIPVDKQQAIFDAFVQADASTTRKFGGTGLGLAIVSNLVGLMGGRIWVESRLGEGSTFHFTARFGLVAAEGAPDQKVSAKGLEALRVLIVDDNATNRRILKDVVRGWGLRPTEAPGAATALEELRRAVECNDPYRLVLSDVQMPDIDGFSLVKSVKQEPALSDTVLILLTSGDRPDDHRRSGEAGAAAHLMKPVKRSELLDAILTALGVGVTRAEVVLGQDQEAGTAVPSLRVLLAEDSRANQRVASVLLGKEGHEVVIAKDGRKAVDAAVSQTFDLVLMDLQMPVMDGFEASERIRQHEKQTGAARVPIIALTAHALDRDHVKCLAVGMDDFLSKPFRLHELRRVISRFSSAQSGAGEPAESPKGSHPILDWEAALRCVDHDQELLKQVVADFLEECPGLREALRRGVRSSEGTTVQRAAHTLRGALRLFEGSSILDRAERLESMGRSQQLSEAQEELRHLESQLNQILPELRRFVESGSAGSLDASRSS